MVWFGGGVAGFNSACSYLSFLLGVKMFPFSVWGQRWWVWRQQGEGEKEGGYEQEGGGGGGEGGGEGGWKWWNSHIILRRLIAIRRAIGDIFITAVKFGPTRLGNRGGGQQSGQFIGILARGDKAKNNSSQQLALGR